MSKSQETRAARIATAKSTRAEALAAHRATLAAVRDAKSAVNREAHRAQPIRVSASAVHAVTGATLADGGTARGKVTEAHAVKYVSIRPLIGKNVTFARTGDAFTASVPQGKSTARTALTAAIRAEAIASKRLASARAAVKRASAPAPKRAAKVTA